MGQRECADLPDQRAQTGGQEKQAQHEQDMIQPLGQDMIEPDGNIGAERRPRSKPAPATQIDIGAGGARINIIGKRLFHALLAQHQCARPLGPAEGQEIGILCNRPAQCDLGDAGQFDIAHLSGFCGDKGQWHGLPACLDLDCFGPVRHKRGQPRLKLCRRQRAQGIVVIGLRGFIGVFNPVQINAGQIGLGVQAQHQRDLAIVHAQIADARRDLMCGHCGAQQRPQG